MRILTEYIIQTALPDLPSMVSGFSAPTPSLPARAASPSEWTLINFSLKNSKSRSQSQHQSHSSDAVPDGDSPAITLFYRQPAPAPPTANIYTVPRSWSPPSPHFHILLLKLASVDYMLSRFAAQPPSIIDHLVGICAAKAATEGGQQWLYGSHLLRSRLVPRLASSTTTDWSVMHISSSRGSSSSGSSEGHRGSCRGGQCQWRGEVLAGGAAGSW